MNKTFKTIWNEARRSYIVTNETQKTHGKPSKCAVALAIATTAFLSLGAAQAAYVDPGLVATSYKNVDQAVASWETTEYKADWGLEAMHASKAYALGYHGQGVAVGVMDSGAYLYHHPDLSGNRFHASVAKGEYSGTGVRYPQGALPQFDADYEAGESFDITGEWVLDTNDSHGTHVTGTVGGNRDGNEFHGVAWGSDVWVGNTGGTDDSNYGPFLDYGYFRTAWGNIAQDLIAANGAERGGVINNSFGTNTRVVDPDGGATTTNNEGQKVSVVTNPGYDGGNTDVHFKTNSTAETEYEYFLFRDNKNYQQTANENGWGSFVDAAWEAVKGTNVVQVFTTGNRDMHNPFYRPLYPYFNPEAEQNWIAVAGLKKDSGSGETAKYSLIDTFNEAGNAKWWTVAAPGDNIYSSAVVEGSYIEPDSKGYEGTKLGDAVYASWGGTSMAAPHVTGAMGVIMSRYQDMNAIQARTVLFTTANHKNPDGTNMEGWQNVASAKWNEADKKWDVTYEEVPEGEVSNRMGWGVPDLDKAMYGPGQFLGKFAYNMANTKLDVWSNNISQVAWDQRKREDSEWLNAANKWLKLPEADKITMNGLTDEEKAVLGDLNELVATDGTLDTDDDLVGIDAEGEKISTADAIKWRTEYFQKRIAAIEARQYDGELVKQGAGTLVMTGNNTYRGGTTVEAGTLLGFNDSFGVTGDDSTANANGKVTVKGGVFGVMSTYNDEFTMKGEISDSSQEHSVDITVKNGGAYGVVIGQDVEVGELTLEKGASLTAVSVDTDGLTKAFQGYDQTGTVTATTLNGAEAAAEVGAADFAFFNTEFEASDKDGTISATISRNQDATFASYASTDAGEAIGNVIEGATDSTIFEAMIGGTKDQVRSTMDSLGSDIYLSAQNASIVNSLSIARAVKDQAIGVGDGRRVEMKDGTARLWATGIGSWSDVDYGTNMDVDTYAGFIGGELDITDNTKIGAFFGYGSTDFDASHDGKIESDDLHFGLYGETTFDKAELTYGIIHTKQDRDISRTINVMGQIGGADGSADANITQVFAEAAYTGFNTDKYAVEPYFGLSYLHITSDDVAQSVAGMSFDTEVEDANVTVTSLGVRGAVPFTVGSVGMQVKGDVAWNHFFGDNEAEGKMRIGDAGFAKIKGEKLDNMATVGLGVEAKLTKDTTFGLSYTGAFDGDITSHGVGANLRINF